MKVLFGDIFIFITENGVFVPPRSYEQTVSTHRYIIDNNNNDMESFKSYFSKQLNLGLSHLNLQRKSALSKARWLYERNEIVSFYKLLTTLLEGELLKDFDVVVRECNRRACIVSSVAAAFDRCFLNLKASINYSVASTPTTSPIEIQDSATIALDDKSSQLDALAFDSIPSTTVPVVLETVNQVPSATILQVFDRRNNHASIFGCQQLLSFGLLINTMQPVSRYPAVKVVVAVILPPVEVPPEPPPRSLLQFILIQPHSIFH
jgi:hypothetical protein